MDYLFTPWRYAYIKSAGQAAGCLFCDAPRAGDDRKSLIVHRGRYAYVMLNAFPYTNGHVMVAPYAHVAQLAGLDPAAAHEMMDLAQRLERALGELYCPNGMNLGMNIGAAAGAGIAGHLHLHVVPRWIADANFMSVVGETRVLPEDLGTTYERVKKELESKK
jgi:ATP adenylyltransferase